MKKITILFIAILFSIKGFSQFATFEPIMPNSGNNSHSSMNSGETVRTTGYILNESGRIQKKIQLKVSVQSDSYGETVSIVSYYNINQGFGANWENVSIRAEAIGGNNPITQQQKVAYSNFTYWAFWLGDKIWFNL